MSDPLITTPIAIASCLHSWEWFWKLDHLIKATPSSLQLTRFNIVIRFSSSTILHRPYSDRAGSLDSNRLSVKQSKCSFGTATLVLFGGCYFLCKVVIIHHNNVKAAWLLQGFLGLGFRLSQSSYIVRNEMLKETVEYANVICSTSEVDRSYVSE